MSTFKRVLVSATAGYAMLLAYALGVLNERTFPGDRNVPMVGEAPFWVTLVALVLVAAAVTWEFTRLREIE